MYYSCSGSNSQACTLLLLCGDIHPCPGPRTYDNSNTSCQFKRQGLHFLLLNVVSSLPKIDEVSFDCHTH